MTGHAYYPLFADLQGRRCVVVGGGAIAQRKVTALLRCGARITVISPTLTKRLAAYARRGLIQYRARQLVPRDLPGAWLVYAATDDQRVNELVYRSATRRRIFTNVVDQPRLCSFIAPAIFRRGLVTVAISTGGASPSLAKQMRRDLARTVGVEYASMGRLLLGLREAAKRRLPTFAGRKRYFAQLIRGRVFRLVRAGRPQEARRMAKRLLAHHAAEIALREISQSGKTTGPEPCNAFFCTWRDHGRQPVGPPR